MTNKIKIGEREYSTPFKYDEDSQFITDADGLPFCEPLDANERASHGAFIVSALNNREEKDPIDILLFCPYCDEQHIDEAAPEVCEDCGHSGEYHGRELSKHPNSECLHCSCGKFNAWLNPPHKSHRCHFCNYVWRPADVPTNGVKAIKTRGVNDSAE
jgi:hypothetical protein